MRIISGNRKGRKLAQLSGTRIRPTSDRIREAIFNILGPKIKGKKVLDLFAGTGALGIEALSRGAIHSTFIDIDCDIISQNLDRCGLKKNARIIRCDITRDNFAQTLINQQFDLVFIDPPYEKGYIESILQKVSFIDLLYENCIIITEQSHKENLDFLPSDLDIYRQKKYSKTLISFIRKL